MRAAEREGRDYEPVTERGRAVHAARQAWALFAEMRERLELARDTYGAEREAGQGRVSADLAALRAAASKDRGADRGDGDIRDRLEGVLNKLRETLERGDDRDAEQDRGDEKKNTREIDREIDRDPGLSH